MRYVLPMSGTEAPTKRVARDRKAGTLLHQLRVDKGLSRDALPTAMAVAGVHRDYIPSARTIYNVEVHGVIPRVRLQFGLAQFYDRNVSAVWGGGPARPHRPRAPERALLVGVS